ncbi:hypothetical protein LTR62_005825 [Meristemomyces frigidus]|uniref:Uncharacterized protein n=1 Tax=Meristemomyces frigidus TaxID=1508187 RepID=A0AAN7TD43_9PEZI|nr:hypothetical protein LTR62_005825 [Meristemomyces frigidus]
MEKIRSMFKHGDESEEIRSHDTPSSSTTHDTTSALHTNPEAEPDRSVTRQTVGTSAETAPQIESRPAAEDKHGVSRQILNPGGDKYDEQRYGTTGTTVPGTEPSSAASSVPAHLRPTESNSRTISTDAIKSGVLGPYASNSQADSSLSTGTEPHGALPDRSLPASSTTGTERGRAFPLSGGVHEPSARYGGEEATSRGLAGTGDRSHLGRDAGIVGVGALGAGALANEGRRDETSHGGLGSDRTAGGLGSTGTTSGLGSERPGSSARDVPGDPFGYHKPDETPVEGYVHHTHGPHATDMANRLDPHVPGEFPGEEGRDRHLGRDAALGGAGLGAAGYEAGREGDHGLGAGSMTGGSSQPLSSTSTDRGALGGDRDTQPHYGRDAGVIGGAGAAGVAGHEALEHHDRVGSAPLTNYERVNQQQSGGLGSGSTQHPQMYGGSKDTVDEPDHTGRGGQFGEMDSKSASLTDRLTGHHGSSESRAADTQRDSERHYGRDAAVAGGAGAAGLAGYEGLKEHERQGAGDTRPHEKYTGLPVDTSKGTGVGGTDNSRTIHGLDSQSGLSGQSSTLPSSSQPEHHYGRDAALAGGAGAAGVGGYEALKDRDHGRDTNTNTIAGAPYSSTTTDPTSRTMVSPLTSNPPQQQEHHYGRDAALVGGTGAAGLGGAEALRSHDQDRKEPLIGGTVSSDPETSNRSSNQAFHSLVNPTTSDRKASSTQPHHETLTSTTQQPEHHYGRDAALVGGTGAAGIAGTEALGSHDRDREHSRIAPSSDPLNNPTNRASTTAFSSLVQPSDRSFENQSSYPATHHTTGSGAGAAGIAASEAMRRDEQGELDAGGKHAHSKLEKSEHQREKHERDLERAREKEAEQGGDHGTGEKKEGFLSKLLHK